MKTELSDSGYGINISVHVKAVFFKKDLAKLLKAYEVALCPHSFAEMQDLYIVNRGTSFAEGHAKVL